MTATLAHIAVGFALGLGFGTLHFATLAWVTALFLSRGTFARALALQLARLAALAALMAGLVALGAEALLAGMVGVIAAREIILRRVRKEG